MMDISGNVVRVTETPTLFPTMLLRPAAAPAWPPFSGSDVHWYYLARNAVYAAVRALGLAGREILMPSYHHGVEVEAVIAAGGQPVFYRVLENWRLDLDDLSSRITANTAALYLIHYAGFPGPVRELQQLADERGLVLIEDCALSLYSALGDQPLGLFGDVGIFCLYKTLPVPAGGALCFNSPAHRRLEPTVSPPRTAAVHLLASSVLRHVEIRAGKAGSVMRRLVRKLGRGTAEAAGAKRIPVGTMHFDIDKVSLGITPSSLRIARRQSAERIVAARRSNYQALVAGLGDRAQILQPDLAVGVCPLFLPIWGDDKPGLVERLRGEGIEAINFWSQGHPSCSDDEFPETARVRDQLYFLLMLDGN